MWCDHGLQILQGDIFTDKSITIVVLDIFFFFMTAVVILNWCGKNRVKESKRIKVFVVSNFFLDFPLSINNVLNFVLFGGTRTIQKV